MSPPPSERSAPSDDDNDERGESEAATNIISVEQQPTQMQTEHTPNPQPAATENGMGDVDMDDGHESSDSAVQRAPTNGLKRTLDDVLSSPPDSSEQALGEGENADQNLLKRRRTTGLGETEHGHGDGPMVNGFKIASPDLCDVEVNEEGGSDIEKSVEIVADLLDFKPSDVLESVPKDIKEVSLNDVADLNSGESVTDIPTKSPKDDDEKIGDVSSEMVSKDICSDIEINAENEPLGANNPEREGAAQEETVVMEDGAAGNVAALDGETGAREGAVTVVDGEAEAIREVEGFVAVGHEVEGKVAVVDEILDAEEQKKEGVDGEAEAIEQTAAVVEEDVTAVEGTMEVDEGFVAATEEKMADVEGEVLAMEEKVAVFEEETEAIEATMAVVDAEVTVTPESATLVDGEAEVIPDTVAVVEGFVPVVEEKVSAHESEVTVTEGETSAIEEIVTAIDTEVAAIEGMVLAVDTALSSSEIGVATIEGEVERTDMDIAETEGELEKGELIDQEPVQPVVTPSNGDGKSENAEETLDTRETSYSDCGELHLFLDDDDEEDNVAALDDSAVQDQTLVADFAPGLVNSPKPIELAESAINISISDDDVSKEKNDLVDQSIKLDPAKSGVVSSKMEMLVEPVNNIAVSLINDWDESSENAPSPSVEVKNSETAAMDETLQEPETTNQAEHASVSADPSTPTNDSTPTVNNEKEALSVVEDLSNDAKLSPADGRIEDNEAKDEDPIQMVPEMVVSEAANEEQTFDIDDNSEAPDEIKMAMEVEAESPTNDIVDIDDNSEAPDDEVMAMEMETESPTNEIVAEESNHKLCENEEPMKSDSVDIHEPVPSASSVAMQVLSKFKTSFKDITREDLEALIMEKMLEAMIFKSRAADNAKKIVVQDQQIGRLKDKLEEVKRQYKVVEAMHSNVTDQMKVHEKTGCKVTAKPVMRTVGIQSQSVHYLRCKNCGVKATTTMSAADAAVKKINGVNEGVTITRIPAVSPKSTSPTTSGNSTAPTTRRISQTGKTNSTSSAVLLPSKAVAKPVKVVPAMPSASEAPPASVAKQPDRNDSFVDLTEDDDPPVIPAQKQLRAVTAVASKPAGSVQRNTSVGASVPPLVGITRNSSRGNHALLRSSQPAPIPTQTVKRGEIILF